MFGVWTKVATIAASGTWDLIGSDNAVKIFAWGYSGGGGSGTITIDSVLVYAAGAPLAGALHSVGVAPLYTEINPVVSITPTLSLICYYAVVPATG